MTENNDRVRARKSRRPMLLLMAGALAILVLLSAGYLPRKENAEVEERAALDRGRSVPDVATWTVQAGNSMLPLLLPGNIEPIEEAVLYARIDGYVNQRLVDIGDRVQKGQLVAMVSSPETDQELRAAAEALKHAESGLMQANAQKASASANLSIAEVTNRRWQGLLTRSVVSQQEADQTEAAWLARRGDLAAAEAGEQSAQNLIGVSRARVDRLKELVSYQRVIAPFPGVITARNIDVGSLVSAGSNAAVPALYKLARIDRMRIFIDLPQSDSGLVHLGQKCVIEVRELSGRSFEGRVTRFSNAIDVASRTMRTEVQLDNPRGELLPGMYAQARFEFERKNPPAVIPANTLIPSPDGDRVVVVSDGVAHFRTIHVAQDHGAQLEVLDGVTVGDTLIVNVNDAIRDGEKVRVTSRAEESPKR